MAVSPANHFPKADPIALLRSRGGLLWHISTALVLTTIAILLRWALHPWIDHAPSLATLWAAIAIAVWLGGWKPAVLTLALGYVAAHALAASDLIFDQPWQDPSGPADVLVLFAVYAFSGGAIIVLGEGMRHAGRRADRLNRQLKARVDELAAVRSQLEIHQAGLEQAVQERTAELQQAHQQLRLAERMAGLGTLAAGLGHDIGNLLLPLRSRINSLESAQLPPRQQKDVEALRAVADYLNSLCNGLRTLAIAPEGSRASESTELSAWWTDARLVMRHALPRRVFLKDDIPEGECWVALSRAAISQIVFNLVQNAGDALAARASGTVVVSARPAGDGRVELRVSDDGPGMPEEIRRRCTDPFFSTKSKPSSSGLGLALVDHLLQQAGGRLAIESEPGIGTSFILSLPRVASAEATSQGHTQPLATSLQPPNPDPVLELKPAPPAAHDLTAAPDTPSVRAGHARS